MKRTFWLSVLLPLFLILGCQNEGECTDCGGGIIGGYLYKTVTQEDLTQLGSIDGIDLEVCIRYKFLDGDEFDTETVSVVDDCCCDLYEL